jgi:alkaline phosphatase D
MLHPFRALLGFALLLIAWSAGSRSLADDLPAQIVFGSCARQDRPQPIWEAIIAKKPDQFLLTGDNIYGDTSDIAVLRGKYQLLGAQPGYQKLLATCPLLATWDDHDYGINDGGADFPVKRESQAAFLDFFRVPADSPRRRQEGVYHSAAFQQGGRQLQVILLDTRYFRSPLVMTNAEDRSRQTYLPNTDSGATILGEAQWKWLEEQLRQPADLRLLVSSIQVLPEQHRFEKWANFPHERARLLSLIRATKAGGVVLISGDRHTAEISRLDTGADQGVGYPLYEITASGLTHAGGGGPDEPNQHRVPGSSFTKINFGGIAVDWEAANPTIRLQIFDITGTPVHEQKIPLEKLRAP